MGVISLDTQNQALLVKWLWRLQKDRQGLWANTMAQLYDLTEASQLREAQYQCSPFLKELSELVPFFACSVTTDTATMDLQWRWTISGAFSCSSAYHTMQESGIMSMYYKVLWKLRVPMKVKIFLWLMIEDKILTQEVLTSRGCAVTPGCVLCRDPQVETRDHMLANCAYSDRVWRGLGAQLNLPPMTGNNPIDIWWKGRSQLQGQTKLRWDTAWAAGVWAIWKERNRRTFSQLRKLEHITINAAAIDVHNWMLFV